MYYKNKCLQIFAIFTDMDNITSLVQYGGKWNQNYEYQGYAMATILIPPNFSLENLLHLIKNEMKDKTTNIEVSYQVEKETPPMKMVTDNSVMFFLEMKKKKDMQLK